MPIYRQPPDFTPETFQEPTGLCLVSHSPLSLSDGRNTVDTLTRLPSTSALGKKAGNNQLKPWCCLCPGWFDGERSLDKQQRLGWNLFKARQFFGDSRATGTQNFLGGPPLTGNPNGLQCYSTTADASFSGPTTDNLLWKASNTTNGTGSIFGLIAVCNATNRFRSANSSLQQFHTFFLRPTSIGQDSRTAFRTSAAGYCFGIQKNTDNLELRVANGSGNSRLVLQMQEPFRWPREFGSLGIFFFSKYFIRPTGQTGTGRPFWILDTTPRMTSVFNTLADKRQPLRIECRTSWLDSKVRRNLGQRTEDSLKSDGTSGVASNYRMCIGGLNQSTYDASKRCNSCCQILECTSATTKTRAASGKLGAIVGEMIEEKEVFSKTNKHSMMSDMQGFVLRMGLVR